MECTENIHSCVLLKNSGFCALFTEPVSRSVHGSSGSGLCLTRNRPEFLGWVKIRTETGFSGLCQSVSSFSVGAKILPGPARSSRYLVGSVKSRLDVDEILSDLIGSDEFHVDLSRKSKNIAGISHFLLEILRMSPDVVDLVVGSGGSGFGGGNPPTKPKGSCSVGGNPQPTVGLVGSGGGQSISGGSSGLVG